jgi:hypothetical protein
LVAGGPYLLGRAFCNRHGPVSRRFRQDKPPQEVSQVVGLASDILAKTRFNHSGHASLATQRPNSRRSNTTGTISVVATYYAGEFNRDGHVDAADVTAMEQALADLPDYEATKGLTDAQLLLIGDINGDGVINNADVQALLDLLNSGGGSTSVPEPSTFVLAVLAVVLVGLFRRS